MEASHKTHRPHIKVGKDEEEEEVDYLFYSMYGGQLLCNIFFFQKQGIDRLRHRTGGETMALNSW